MKLKITRIEEVEVPDAYPHYRKSGTIRCHYFMVYNSTSCMSVYVGHQGSIQINDISNAYYASDIVECTQEEFEFAYTEVNERLREISGISWMRSINQTHSTL